MELFPIGTSFAEAFFVGLSLVWSCLAIAHLQPVETAVLNSLLSVIHQRMYRMRIEDSKASLRTFVQRFDLLSEEEITTFVDAFKPVQVKKRQFIVQPGFTAKHKNYVVQGAFRSFVIGDKGTDHTISFAIEDWWITDYNSYIYQQPATMFVVALEDGLILQISYEREHELKAANHHFETLFRIMTERGLAFLQRRMISNLTQSAPERYDLFVEKYPQIVQRLPQYALASFLGMTTEFLSKIRNNKVRKG